MKLLKAPLIAAMAGVSAMGLSVAAPADTQAAAAQIPIEVWSLRNVVNAVQVSPDGKHVLVHINPTREGEYLLQIFKTDDLTKPYRTLNADPMEIISARWVNDNFIFGTAWQVKDKTVKGPEEDIRRYLAYSYDLKKNKFNNASGNFQIINDLPNDPDHVLIGGGNAIPDTTGVDPFAAFRPRAYYKFNLNTGSRRLILKGSEKYPIAVFDNNGNPRFTQSVNSANELVQYYRLPGDGSWTEFGTRYDQDDHQNLYRVLGGIHGVQAFDPDNPNLGYVIDNEEGEDKAALWKYDFSTGQKEKLFQRDDADVMGVLTHSMPDNDRVVAAIYPGAKYERHWFDEDEKALYEALEAQIPYAHQVSITSRSRDGNTMVVQNSGPRDPGSFWIVINGKIAKLGSRNPLINPRNLADTTYIRYPARDGLEIPAYLTLPEGEGPFPLIVQHNGGPHVNAVRGWGEMTQLLANAGYAVLYPNNRISTGWGQKHFDAGYGEHGLAMQDDKDDGVKYLVEQGIVDPDRVAFFGWSYGGYAALVAASRPDNLYQCTIAVAAVADAAKVYRTRSGPNTPKAIDDWAQRRGMIGINPINEVSKVNIPLLMVHPKQDRRVLYFNFTDYKKAFEQAGKDGQFMTVDGADHFSNTWMFDHQQQLYTKMLDFLANDCGPDGL